MKVLQPESLITRVRRLERAVAAVFKTAGLPPHLPWQVTLAADLAGVAVASDTFVTTHRLDGLRLYPRLRVQLTTSADAGVAGEVQLLPSAGDPVVAEVVLADAGTVHTLIVDIAGDYLSAQVVEVQARRTAGAGSLRVAVTRVEGLP